MELRFSDLPPAFQYLVEKMRSLGFGVIDNLRVVGGLPVFDQDTTLTRRFRFDSNTAFASRQEPEDYCLKSVIVEMVCHFATLKDHMTLSLVVKDGLPSDVQYGVLDG